MKKILFLTLITISCRLISQVPYDSLLLNMPFNGSAVDVSGNAFNGVVNGAVLCPDRFGIQGSAYKFDGIDDYIEILNFGDTVPTDEITVSMWVKSYESKAQFQMMLCPDNSRFAVSINYFHSGMNTTFWDFGFTGASGDSPGRLYYRPEPVDTLWHHYVFMSSTVEGSMKIYKDDTLLISKDEPLSLVDPSGKSLKIGSGDGTYYFNGLIDDLRIYCRDLDSVEVDGLFYEDLCISEVTINDTVEVFDTITVYDTIVVNCCKPFPQAPSDSLLLDMPFSGSAVDVSGNGFNGVVNGAILCPDRFGVSGNAYKFDGIDDYIEILNFGDTVPTDEITVSMWVKSYETRGQFQMMLCPDNNRFAVSINYFHAGMNTTFWDYGWSGAGGDASGRLYYRPEPVDTLWHHYVFVSSTDENYMKIYKDDSLLTSKDEPLSLIDPSGKSLMIGSGDGAYYFNGLIDDIKIYCRDLNSVEVDGLFYEGDCKQRVIVYDTITVSETVYDSVAVTDTLIIDVDLTGVNPVTDNTIKVFPNPTKDIVYINNGDYESMEGYSVRIINVSSEIIFESEINTAEFQVNISKFGSVGLYFIQILNENSELVDVRKIILE